MAGLASFSKAVPVDNATLAGVFSGGTGNFYPARNNNDSAAINPYYLAMSAVYEPNKFQADPYQTNVKVGFGCDI